MSDQIIRCADCDSEFIFSEGEQQFYAERQFTTPKRCRPCRAIAKQRIEARQMRDFGGPPRWTE